MSELLIIVFGPGIILISITFSLLLQILGTDVIYTFDHPISGQQEAEIFEPVVVNPEIILFPWYPAAQQDVAAQNQFQYLLEVTEVLDAQKMLFNFRTYKEGMEILKRGLTLGCIDTYDMSYNDINPRAIV